MSSREIVSIKQEMTKFCAMKTLYLCFALIVIGCLPIGLGAVAGAGSPDDSGLTPFESRMLDQQVDQAQRNIEFNNKVVAERTQRNLDRERENSQEIPDSILVILTIVIMLFLGYLFQARKDKFIKVMDAKLGELNDFVASQKVIGENGETGIAIDEQRKKVCLIKHNAGNIDLSIISYRDLLVSEIFEDGIPVTKTSRISQAGTAIVGGLLFGGVGAVVGGLTGKTTTVDKIKGIDLRLTVNSTQAPIHDVNFMNIKQKKGGVVYNEAMQQARHWQGLIEVLIRRADEEDRKNDNLASVKVADKHSVADELSKLVKLKEQGILSEEEFAEQKAKLLSNG